MELSEEQRSTLERIQRDAGELARCVSAAVARIDARGLHGTRYEKPALEVDRALAACAEMAPKEMPGRLRAIAVAALLGRLPDLVERLRPPPGVLECYPPTAEKICRHLRALDAIYERPDDDAFVKDVRLLLGLSLPCGAQSVEVDDHVRLRSLLKHALATGDPAPLRRLAMSAVGSFWFGIHTDSRDVSEFNEQGWIECYRRIGTLLEQQPAVAGVVGTSWFFDPQLLGISPRLGYLQTLPLRNGAVAFRNGPGPVHTARATATSETRKQLFEQGKYLPVCYTIAWPREPLLNWCSAGRPVG